MAAQQFFDLVAKELEQGQLDRGLWAKAFADADGDDARTRALYLRARAARLEQDALATTRRERARHDAEQRAAMAQGRPILFFVLALIIIALLAIWFLWPKT